MPWSVTGWSGGSRQPLTYRLRAGQFRGMGTVRGYSNNIFINNNYQGFSGYNYGYNYGCNCDSGSSTPKWMNWMMGLGLGTSFFGNILSMFGFGGGGAVEGQGGSKTNTDAQAEADKNCKNIRTLYGDDFVKAVVFINGEYNARLNDGTILKATEPSELINKINEKRNTKPDETHKDDPPSTPSEPEVTSPTSDQVDEIAKVYSDNNTNGKFGTTNAPVKFSDINSDTSINISGVYDDGTFNGSEIKDFIFKSPVSVNNLSKGQIVTIGKNTYEVVEITAQDGTNYIGFKDNNPKDGDTNEQIYILERAGDSYTLHQRPELSSHTKGVNKYAH